MVTILLFIFKLYVNIIYVKLYKTLFNYIHILIIILQIKMINVKFMYDITIII